MRRIDGDRRDHRQDLLEEALIEPLVLVGGEEFLAVDNGDAVLGQFLLQLQPAPVLFGHQLLGKFADLLELLGRRQPIVADFRDICSRTWPTRPATRTMKNSSRLLPEMERKRSRSSKRMDAGSGPLPAPAC